MGTEKSWVVGVKTRIDELQKEYDALDFNPTPQVLRRARELRNQMGALWELLYKFDKPLGFEPFKGRLH